MRLETGVCLAVALFYVGAWSYSALQERWVDDPHDTIPVEYLEGWTKHESTKTNGEGDERSD